MPKEQKPNFGAIAFTVLFFVVIFLVLRSCFTISPEEEKANRAASVRFNFHQNCVLQILKNPSSSEFDDGTTGVMINDTTEIFRGRVRAANGLGITVKKGYLSVVTCNTTTEKCICGETFLID